MSLTSASLAATIHEAAESGDLAQVQRLIMGGTSVNEKTIRDETPLIVATLAGQGEIARYLLQRGANIDVRNESGLSALHAAAYAGQSNIVRLLIAKGAKVNDAKNEFGVTPLHLAAEENHIDTVRILLRLGAEPAALEVNGYSALSRAGWREHWGVVNELLANGATCQPADIVGEWLYQECTTRAAANKIASE
jgi:ankyrin repeat protein